MLGVDPGTAITGYGVLEPDGSYRPHLIECGVIRTSPRRPLSERLAILYEGVSELIERHHPQVLAVESAFYGRNVRTTLTLGHARGVILLAAARAGLEVAEFAPRAIKKSVVGKGNAAKSQVGYMVQHLLNLRQPPSPDDAADGVAVALTYVIQRRRGLGGRRGTETQGRRA